MKKKINTLTLFLSLAMLISAVACSGGSTTTEESGRTIVPGLHIDYDRDGNDISLPETVSKIISIGPSNTEVLVALGFADMIIATDAYSANVPGLKPGISDFSMMDNDGELIIEMQPDLIFVTGMSRAQGEDPYKVLADVGLCLIYMPSSTSIAGIMEDIRYMAEVLAVEETGEEILEVMQAKIDEILAITNTSSEVKKVYYEIAAAPNMYSFGGGTFLHEMIELLGAVNIFADTIGWASVSDEAILEADPDIILTTVNYIENPVEEIKSRDGWNAITAIKNDDVYYISTDASNRPSHNVVIAMQQMAEAIYPELFEG